LHAQVRIVRTDKGTKFLNKTLHAYFSKEGIEHQTSTAQAPEQNGIVERQNRTLVKAARTILRYSTTSRAYRVYNKRTRVIVETIHVNFDKLPHMASDHISSDPVPQCLAVETSSAVTAADAPDRCQPQNITSSTSTMVAADIPPLNIQTTPETTSQVPTQAPTVTAIENTLQAETNKEYAQVKEDEFTNIFSTPVQERRETSSRYVDLSNMHTFYQ
ncbi:retrovirus-related pol polyprotein from transposon TNT 1-94, partial [Tanacetum coccineum]